MKTPNSMKKILIRLFCFAVVCMLMPSMPFGIVTSSLSAQTSTYSTITTAAINTTQTCFVLAATTSMQASGAASGPGGQPQEWDLWFDGEWAKINTVNTTSNQVCVMRGKSPTRAGPHATASIVFYGPAGKTPFVVSAPDQNSPGVVNLDGQFGSCVSTNYTFLPLINVTNGSIYNCLPTLAQGALGTVGTNSYGKWVVYGFRQWTTGHPVTMVNDAAYTATLADEFIIVERLTAARTITFPAITGIQGKAYVIINNTENGNLITLAPSASQLMATSTSITLSPSVNNNRIRLISVPTSAGGWAYATW